MRTKARIMIVEDQGLVARDVQRRLERMGYDVVGTQGKPAPAMAMALAEKPDLVLMDINLNAEQDGIDVAIAIQKEIDIPVVYCTAYSDDEMLQRASVTTPYGYVLKPFEDRELEITIEIALFKHRAELAQQLDSLRLEATMDGIADAVVACDATGQVFLFNPRAEAMIEISAQEAIGADIDELLHLKDIDSGAEKVDVKRSLLERAEPIRELRQVLISESGSATPIDLSATPIKLAGQERGGVVVAFRDISKQLSYEEQIQKNAFVEPLTGLPNKNLFVDRLKVALRRTWRQQGYVCGVLFVDLDGFRNINESEGHDLGDQVLKLVSGRIERALRDTDTVTRFSADTFVCLLDGLSGEPELQRVVSAVQSAIARPFDLGDHLMNLTATIGAALSSESDYADHQEMLRDADSAMHQAKLRGSGLYAMFEAPMRDSAVRSVKLAGRMQQAMADGAMKVYYQPIVEAESEQIVALEALLRWRSPELGQISPSEFIPVAEQTGLITMLGEHVLNQVCRQLKDWQDAGVPLRTVGINLSPTQFNDGRLIHQLADTLAGHELAARWLGLEITETTAMSEVERSIEVLNRCVDLGLKISIDDFGTGYSSLAYLKRLPLHTLKIDRAFITDIVHSQEDQAIVKGIIAMAHELRLDVLAEGIEDANQAKMLRDFGCDYLQGFLFGRPSTAESTTEHLLGSHEDRQPKIVQTAPNPGPVQLPVSPIKAQRRESG